MDTVTAPAAVRARWAITAVFGGNGLLIASLVARTPSLKVDLGLSPAQLGLTSAVFGVAAVLAMQLTGAVAARLGSARVVRAATLVLPVALVGVGAAPGLGPLLAVLLLLGTAHGMLDVTQNAHAVAVERHLGRPIMNGCHAAWSIGAVVGSVLGSAAAGLGVPRWAHYLVLGTVGLVPGAIVYGRRLLPAGADRVAPLAGRARGGRRPGWTRRVALLGAMGATVLTVEAAIANWSGVFLHERVGTSLGVAGLGYVAFTACQTVGRMLGDRWQARSSATRLVRTGAVLAAAGLAVVVVSPAAGPAVAGFALVGIGLATPLPVLFGVVGRLGAAGDGDGDGAGAAATVARFATMTYAGILLAPPLIGWIAQSVGLTGTLTLLIPALLAVAAGAGIAGRRDEPLTGERLTGERLTGETPPGGTRPNGTVTNVIEEPVTSHPAGRAHQDRD